MNKITLHFLLIAFFLCFNNFGFAQNAKIELLDAELNKILATGDSTAALAYSKNIFAKIESLSDSSPNIELQIKAAALLITWAAASPSAATKQALKAMLPVNKKFDVSRFLQGSNLISSAEVAPNIDFLLLALCEKNAAAFPESSANLYMQLATNCYYTNTYDSIAPRFKIAEANLAKITDAQTREGMSMELYSQSFYYYWGNIRNYEDAELYLNKLLALNYDKTQTTMLSALLYQSKGDFDRALALVESLINSKIEISNTASRQMTMILAKCYLAQNQLTKFKSLIKKADKQSLADDNIQILILQYLLLTGDNSLNEHIFFAANSSRSAPYNLLVETKQAIKSGQMSPEKRAAIIATLKNMSDYNISSQSYKLPETGESYLCMADVYAELGERGIAKNYYDTALSVLSGAPVGEIKLDNIKDYYTSLRIFKGQLLSDINEEGKEKFSAAALQSLGQIRKNLTSRGAKEIALNEAPFFYEAALKQAFDKYQKNPSPALFEAALRISDQSKSTLLLESLKENNALSFGGVPDSIRRAEKSLTSDISLYEAESNRAQLLRDTAKYNLYSGFLLEKRQKLADLKKVLERDYPKYYQIKHKETEVSLAALQAALPDQQTALIEIFAGEKQLFIFCISTNGHSLISKPIDGQYNRRLIEYFELLTQPQAYNDNKLENTKAVAKAGYDIYSLVLAEAMSKLPAGITRLVFMPDGLLTYIPLDALCTSPPAATADFKAMDFLLHKYAVSYHYSLSLWLEARNSKKSAAAKQGIFALAPSYGNAEGAKSRAAELYNTRRLLKELAGTKIEVDFIEKLFSKGLYLKDNNATESEFKKAAAEYAILHLAMHGVVDKDNPMYSAMVFTEDGSAVEDNFLYAYELQNMQLYADLVVLSACETGQGKYQHGEGVVSLGRGFMYAGVPNLVMTLWSINDQSTAVIMQYFYEGIKKGLSTDVAMQQAKIEYLRTQNGLALHPNFWSAFTVVGKAQPIPLSSSNIWFWVIVAGAGIVLLYTLFMLYSRRNDEPKKR
jgi:CHAT domain-containing protein